LAREAQSEENKVKIDIRSSFEVDDSLVLIKQFESDQNGVSNRSCSSLQHLVGTCVRQPLADVYIVESFKEYNWENTDHLYEDGARDVYGSPNVGLNLVKKAQDMAEENCNIF